MSVNELANAYHVSPALSLVYSAPTPLLSYRTSCHKSTLNMSFMQRVLNDEFQ